MYFTHLALTDFRNYRHLQLGLPRGVVVLQGDNAQGKTSLLEAIYLLSTTRSHRTATERELVNWQAMADPAPLARLVATVCKGTGDLHIEVTMLTSKAGLEGTQGPARDPGTSPLQKRIKVNGIPRRASDAVGQVNVVLFDAQDVDIVAGPPTLRRRFLDVANSQVDPRYLRALQRYSRVLPQRNSLLRLIREGKANEGELAFWDTEMVESGAFLMLKRASCVWDLQSTASQVHGRLTGGGEALEVRYIPSFGGPPFSEAQGLAQDFRRVLLQLREKELAQGLSLAGPHRDDLTFCVNNMDMATYGSRGQQRTIALSLRLAEAEFMRQNTGEEPVLLLDDILPEMDSRRRHRLAETLAGHQQVILAVIDLDMVEPSLLSRAALFKVAEGKVEPRP